MENHKILKRILFPVEGLITSNGAIWITFNFKHPLTIYNLLIRWRSDQRPCMICYQGIILLFHGLNSMTTLQGSFDIWRLNINRLCQKNFWLKNTMLTTSHHWMLVRNNSWRYISLRCMYRKSWTRLKNKGSGRYVGRTIRRWRRNGWSRQHKITWRNKRWRAQGRRGQRNRIWRGWDKAWIRVINKRLRRQDTSVGVVLKAWFLDKAEDELDVITGKWFKIKEEDKFF